MTKCLFYCKSLLFHIENGSRHHFSSCQPFSKKDKATQLSLLHNNALHKSFPAATQLHPPETMTREMCAGPSLDQHCPPSYSPKGFLPATALMQNRQSEKELPSLHTHSGMPFDLLVYKVRFEFLETKLCGGKDC